MESCGSALGAGAHGKGWQGSTLAEGSCVESLTLSMRVRDAWANKMMLIVEPVPRVGNGT